MGRRSGGVRGVSTLIGRTALVTGAGRGLGRAIALAPRPGGADVVLAGRTPDTAAKMAVIGLTTTLAHEVDEYDIAVNAASPGPVRGPRMDRNFALDADVDLSAGIIAR